MGFFEDMVAAGALQPRDVTDAEDSQRRSVLVRTRSRTNRPAPAVNADPIERYRIMGNDLMAQADAMDAEKPDYSLFQKYAAQQRRQGDASMLNALAAQFAGDDFAPVQAQYLKRAMAAQEPVKIGNYGYVGADGEVVIDPMHQREKTIDNLRRRAIQLETLASNAETARERIAAQRAQQEIMNEIRLMNAQTQRIMVEGRYGDKTPMQPVPVEGEAMKPQIITPGTQVDEAVGLEGAWLNFWNKAGDAIGLSSADSPNRVATERLEALANMTQIDMQDAVPGRPSNYLLQMLEKQTVRPNQVFMGEAGAQSRAEATLAIINRGISDYAEIINNPNRYSKDDVAKAVRTYRRLSDLKANYDQLLKGFGDESAAPSDEVDALVQQYLK